MSSRPSRTERYAKTFRLVGTKGERIYPIRELSSMAFVLAPRGARTHHKEHKIYVVDEAKAHAMVASGTYKIRAVREGDSSPSLLALGDHAVREVIKL